MRREDYVRCKNCKNAQNKKEIVSVSKVGHDSGRIELSKDTRYVHYTAEFLQDIQSRCAVNTNSRNASTNAWFPRRSRKDLEDSASNVYIITKVMK